MILLHFRSSIRQIHTILNVSSDYPERRYRPWRMGSIYINGEKLEESYGREVIHPETIGRAAEPIVLGEEEYFVMGDNRNNSSDSRTDIVGILSRKILSEKHG